MHNNNNLRSFVSPGTGLAYGSNGYTAPHDGEITMTFSGQIPLGYRRGEASSTDPVLVTRSGVCMAGCATFTGDARGAEQAAAPFTFELYEVVTPALRNGGSGQICPTQKGHTVKMLMIVFLGFALQGCLALQPKRAFKLTGTLSLNPSHVIDDRLFVLKPKEKDDPAVLIGYDRFTGKEVWEYRHGNAADDITDFLIVEDTLFFGSESLIVSVDLDTGKENWRKNRGCLCDRLVETAQAHYQIYLST